MTEEDNYKLYLDEKFKSLTTLVNAQFKNVDDRLEDIHTEAKRTNGRISKLEEFREYTKEVIDTRVTNCPNVKRFDKIEQQLEDISFVSRHPKLFVAGLVFVVILTLATFLESNSLKVFYKQPPTTEQTK